MALTFFESSRDIRACSACGGQIRRQNLHLAAKCSLTRFFFIHLRCFKPKRPFELSLHETDLQKLSETEVEIALRWVDTWNRELRVKVPGKYLKKSVQSSSPSSRRVLLEVFAYLVPSEIEHLAALACKEWFHVTRDEELWRRKYFESFPPPLKDSSYRRQVIAERLRSCWHCGKPLKAVEAEVFSPLHNRWLCRTCSELDECQVEALEDYCARTCLSVELADTLQVPVFFIEGVKSVYICVISERVVPYAQRRIERLIQSLPTYYDPALCAKVEEVINGTSLKDMYCSRLCLLGNEWTLAKFLGKCEANDQRNIAELVAELT